jgi:glutathione S-transferase
LLPILYTFRRCPYAIRARIALSYANIPIEEREVDLKNKPIELLQLSPKATVPVLVLENRIIDQSLEIIKWALRQSDPEQWLSQELEQEIDALIYLNDYQFKPLLDKYKYSSSAELHDQIGYREQAGTYLHQLNRLLMQHRYLLADSITVADIAIVPFIRQFCMVDEKWFMASEYTFLINWLEQFLDSELFLRVMVKKV